MRFIRGLHHERYVFGKYDAVSQSLPLRKLHLIIILSVHKNRMEFDVRSPRKQEKKKNIATTTTVKQENS